MSIETRYIIKQHHLNKTVYSIGNSIWVEDIQKAKIYNEEPEWKGSHHIAQKIKCQMCKDEGWLNDENGITSSPCPMNCKDDQRKQLID